MKKTNVNPATTATATPAEKGQKDMKATTKPAEKKPASKPATKPANSKKAPAKELSKEEKAKTFYVDKNEVNLLRVTTSVTPAVDNGQLVYIANAGISGKIATLPKCIKDGQNENFGKLVFGKVLDNMGEKFASTKASIEQTVSKRGTPATDKEEADKEAIDKAQNTIETLRKLYKVGRANIVKDELAFLLACKFTGDKLPIETTALRNALKVSYATLHKISVNAVKDGTATMTEEDKENVKLVRDTLVSTMSVFCKETTWNKSFKLSASAEDAVSFYELSLVGYKDSKPIFIWDTDKKGNDMKKLHDELTDWLLRKMKAEF